MSRKSSGSEYIILVVLGLLVAAVLLWLAVSDELGGGSLGSYSRSSRLAQPRGTLACYLLFEKLGVEVRRTEEPLLDYTLQDVDVLLLLDPLVSLQEGEEEAIGDWVSQGGVLVSTSGDRRIEFFRRGISGLDDGPTFRRLDGMELDRATQVPQEPAGLPLARDVARVRFLTDEGIDLPDASGQRSTRALFADSTGVRIVERRQGLGRVITLADCSFLANGCIGRQDNAILAANLAAYVLDRARGSALAFDEYHTGTVTPVQGESILVRLLFTTAPGWSVLCLTVAGICYLFLRGRRFGTRRRPSRVRRRSALEYVTSVGATYRASAAHRLTFSLIWRWFRQRGGTATGLPGNVDPRTLAQALARRANVPPEPYCAVLEECDRAARGPRLSWGQLHALLGRLAAIESEVLDGSARGK